MQLGSLKEELVHLRKGIVYNILITSCFNFIVYSIFQDVLLNKKLSLTDQEALIDSKRSLSQMIYDFLSQHGRKMGDAERRRIASQMDMTPISVEYELELRCEGCMYITVS
jgi:hypothetical protein